MRRLRGIDGTALHVICQCRGEGLGYVLVGSSRRLGRVQAVAALRDQTPVPCAVYPVDSPALREELAPGMREAWVVVLPLLACDCVLRFSDDHGPLLDTTFSAKKSKVSSRLLAMRKPGVAATLRGYERGHAFGRTRVCIAEVWPAGDGEVVWRIRAVYACDTKEMAPRLRVYDDRAQELDVPVVVMEDQTAPDERDQSALVRIVTYSCRLPESQGSFYAVADLEPSGLLDGHSYEDPRGRSVEPEAGFDAMNAPRAAGWLGGARALVGGASANADYARWFEAHRVTDAEIARQCREFAALPQPQTPLVSLVMPVFRTPKEFLSVALASVMAQSYGRWELVIVNASGACDEVDEVLAQYADERIRVIEVENRTIAQNTNDGIAATRGAYVGFMDHDDVLEPDALWHVVQALRSHPEADLIYSDEDHLDGTRLHGPAFKPFPNYGKLYTHNYVTHLLVVSRWALERTERSGAEVSGAQDYDLTLKVFEVARDVVHVPRVLYHWREHEGSTSGGGAQKPYAHVAGQRALQAHLERRGIAAEVDDGALPYTYRVRYRLPDPVPRVSVVIPTRDQSALLRACVESILDRSTYPDYEIVLVENNSRDPQTFALYEELKRRDGRVRVVTWEPPAAGAFNYSAIVNYGVSQSSGELVVLLNNDTEAIEPHWLEEMAGCLMRPEVGVVGAKLLFGDGLIQHVGMAANPIGDFCHVCQNLTRDALGPGYAAAMPGDYSMVTGACQMVRRSLYDELGGYDERLAVGFNDGDFCLRAREAGYAVTVCAHAVLHHREFATRGRERTDVRLRQRFLEERAYTMTRHAAFFAQGDPALNPNLDPYGAYFDLA